MKKLYFLSFLFMTYFNLSAQVKYDCTCWRGDADMESHDLLSTNEMEIDFTLSTDSKYKLVSGATLGGQIVYDEDLDVYYRFLIFISLDGSYVEMGMIKNNNHQDTFNPIFDITSEISYKQEYVYVEFNGESLELELECDRRL